MLQAVADTFVDQDEPTDTNGSATLLESKAEKGEETRVYVRFTVPTTISGKTIQFAYLSLRNEAGHSCAYSALMPTTSLPGAAWSESTLSWNTRPANGACSGTTLTQQKGQANSSYGAIWCRFNATDRVKCWAKGVANYGLVIGHHYMPSSSGPRVKWYSRESTSSTRRPVLWIRYTP